MFQAVYVSHPVRSDPEGNLRKIFEICEGIYEEGLVPVAPYVLAMYSLPPGRSLAEDRELVRKTCEAYLASGFVTEMRLYGESISAGMLDDMALADKFGIPFKAMTLATVEAFIEYEHARAGVVRRTKK